MTAALAAAQSGDQIWVQAGTHVPTQPAGRAANFQLVTGVSIYGGFDGIETLLTDRNPATNLTILSGEAGCAGPGTSSCCTARPTEFGCDDSACQTAVCGPDLGCCFDLGPGSGWDQDCADSAVTLCCALCASPTPSDNAYHIVTASGTDSTALLDGFVIEAGNANGTESAATGAGLYIVGGSPTIIGCTFRSNRASDRGGAVYAETGAPAFTDCTFTENTANKGGAVYLKNGAPTFTDCVFQGNSLVEDNDSTADEDGAAIYAENAATALTECIFQNNGPAPDPPNT